MKLFLTSIIAITIVVTLGILIGTLLASPFMLFSDSIIELMRNS